jgi:hypothetical protein
MKQIKFKAKSVEDGSKGQWIYGLYRVIPLFDYDQPIGFRHVIDDDNYLSMPPIEIDPETLCQFTGHHDDKKREVYENDIYFDEIEYDYGDERVYFICTWVEEWARFVMLSIGEYFNYEDNGAEAIKDNTLYHAFEFNLEKLHYAGNIFDNPELLK